MIDALKTKLFLNLALVLFSTVFSVHAADLPVTVWDSGSKEVDALARQLVSTRPAPYPNGYYDSSWNIPYVCPQVDGAMTKLKMMGPRIFPNLIKHLRDDRYSYSGISAAWDNYTVGDAVVNILSDGHELAFVYKIRKSPAGHVSYLSFKHYLDARGAEQWAAWATNRTRLEIQMNFIDWCIAKEQERGFTDEAQKKWLLDGYQKARERIRAIYSDQGGTTNQSNEPAANSTPNSAVSASYKHVLVARIDGQKVEDKGPYQLTPLHFTATIVKSYKGDWQVSEKIRFVHHVDAPASALTVSNEPPGTLVFIFTNEHTNTEITLDTGEWGHYNPDLAPALEYLYPERKN